MMRNLVHIILTVPPHLHASTLHTLQHTLRYTKLVLLPHYRCNICILLFFLMIRLPPTSPLFPYTTLFRSASLLSEACSHWNAQPMSGRHRGLIYCST